MQQPKRKEFAEKLVWEWTDACFDATCKRQKFIEDTLSSSPGKTTDVLLPLCYNFLAEFIMDDKPQTVQFFHALGIDQSQCPGVFDSVQPQECLFCQGEHAEQESKKKFTIEPNCVLVFDTETTGLSKSDVIIQLGFVLSSSLGKSLLTYEKLWKSDVPVNSHTFEVHGISDSKLRIHGENGKEQTEHILGIMKEVLQKNGTIVAHNAAFDKRLLKQTAEYYGVPFPDLPIFCTMKAIKKRSPAERGPNSKNEDVYSFLGGPDVLGRMHQALSDSQATSYIFFQGKQKKWW